jgi:hypothetical protein
LMEGFTNHLIGEHYSHPRLELQMLEDDFP